MPELDPDQWQRAIARLEQRVATEDVQDALAQVIRAAVDAFGVAGGGLMLVDDDGILQAASASDEVGHLLETVQAEIGEGPCVDCLLLDRVVLTDDVRTDATWPRLLPRVADQPIGAVLGVPVRLAGGAVGALNVFRDAPYRWNEGDVGALSAFGRILEMVVAGALLGNRQDRVIQQLQQALDHRVEIERAVGLLMGRHGIDAVEAFNQLRTMARSSRRKVVEIARELLGRRGGG
jgi:GAF domain-containing protein